MIKELSAIQKLRMYPGYHGAIEDAVAEIEKLENVIAKLRALLSDTLVVLESKWGKEAKAGSLIFEIRKALAEQEK